MKSHKMLIVHLEHRDFKEVDEASAKSVGKSKMNIKGDIKCT